MGVVAMIAGVACVFVAVRSQEWLMTRERRARRGLERMPGLGRAFARGYGVGLLIYAFGGGGLLLIAVGVAQMAQG